LPARTTAPTTPTPSSGSLRSWTFSPPSHQHVIIQRRRYRFKHRIGRAQRQPPRQILAPQLHRPRCSHHQQHRAQRNQPRRQPPHAQPHSVAPFFQLLFPGSNRRHHPRRKPRTRLRHRSAHGQQRSARFRQIVHG